MRFEKGNRYCDIYGFKKGRIPDNWKGGRIIDSHGYVQLWRPLHSNSVCGYVPEHRLVYEESRNCCLLRWVLIHHKDRNRSNNVWYNLEAITRNNHSKLHNIGNRYIRGKKRIPDRLCHLCTRKTYINKHGHEFWIKYNDDWICGRCYHKLNYKKTKRYQSRQKNKV